MRLLPIAGWPRCSAIALSSLSFRSESYQPRAHGASGASDEANAKAGYQVSGRMEVGGLQTLPDLVCLQFNLQAKKRNAPAFRRVTCTVLCASWRMLAPFSPPRGDFVPKQGTHLARRHPVG